MKAYSGLENLEINAPKKYFSHTENAFLRVISDKDNPDSFDANFAVLKSIENVAESVKQTEIIHEAAGAVPHFVSAPDSVCLESAKEALSPYGYVFCNNSLTAMVTKPRIGYKDIMPLSCDVRIHTCLTGEERSFIISQSGEEEYGALILDKKLAAGAKLFIAYNSDKEPVCSCVFEGYGEALLISGVYTRENARRRGFARATMCAALQHAHEKCYDSVYLYVTKPSAQVFYERLYFTELCSINMWKAFKGDLPDWVTKNIVKR